MQGFYPSKGCLLPWQNHRNSYLKLLHEINEVHTVSKSFSVAFDLFLEDRSVSPYGEICLHFSLRVKYLERIKEFDFLSTGSRHNDRLPFYHYIIVALLVSVLFLKPKARRCPVATFRPWLTGMCSASQHLHTWAASSALEGWRSFLGGVWSQGPEPSLNE